MPARRERGESRRRVLELDRHVAGVEAHAEMAPEGGLALGAAEAGQAAERGHRRRREQVALEEAHGLVHGLHVAAGLGLERERDHLAGALPEPVEPGRVADHQLRHPAFVGRAADAPLEGARHGADRALEPGLVRQERGEQLGQAVAVREARVVEPVGEVDLLLDARPVERPVGEAVDREDVEAAVPEEGPERIELRRLGERGRRHRGETQTHAERPGRRHGRLDPRRRGARGSRAPRPRSPRDGCSCSR